jgi:hypothetical protein
MAASVQDRDREVFTAGAFERERRATELCRRSVVFDENIASVGSFPFFLELTFQIGVQIDRATVEVPLGEAVDSGIVKTPIIGRADEKLKEQPGENAAYVFERHLLLGYERWKTSRDEWKKSNKKALLFVICNSTDEANQITQRLNTDELFNRQQRVGRRNQRCVSNSRPRTAGLHLRVRIRLRRDSRQTRDRGPEPWPEAANFATDPTQGATCDQSVPKSPFSKTHHGART